MGMQKRLSLSRITDVFNHPRMGFPCLSYFIYKLIMYIIFHILRFIINTFGK